MLSKVPLNKRRRVGKVLAPISSPTFGEKGEAVKEELFQMQVETRSEALHELK